MHPSWLWIPDSRCAASGMTEEFHACVGRARQPTIARGQGAGMPGISIHVVDVSRGVVAWTDDYSDIIGAMLRKKLTR